MNLRYMASKQKVLRIHQPGNGKPAFNSRWPRNQPAGSTALKVSGPKIELKAEPAIQEQEKSLHNVTRALGMVRCEATNKGLLGLRKLQRLDWVAWPYSMSLKHTLTARCEKGSDLGHRRQEAQFAQGTSAMTTGARQKAAFPVEGSRTVTWHSYWPGLRLAALTSKLSGVIPSRVVAFGATAMGGVLSASAPFVVECHESHQGFVAGCAAFGALPDGAAGGLYACR